MAALVQVHLSDDLKTLIDRQIAPGLAAPEADYLQIAIQRYAADLDVEASLETIAQAGIADIEAGHYALLETEADIEALHQRIIRRVRAVMGSDPN